MLSVEALEVWYGKVPVLSDVSLHVNDGECVAVLGHNGAGKTTLLRTIAGLLAPRSGSIEFIGASLLGVAPEKIARLGVSLVPEKRRIFPQLTVEENLQLGGTVLARPLRRRSVGELMERFPVLAGYRSTPAGRLSGGEQQQLVIARALMTHPRLLLLDEPSLGLAPIVVDAVFDLLAGLRREGTTMLLIEQNVGEALALADRAYLLRTGTLAREGRASDLASAPDFHEQLLGFHSGGGS